MRGTLRRLIPLALVTPLLIPSSAGAITHGTVDDPQNPLFPNVGVMVVQIDDDRIKWCSGTLIAQGVFLTASHCLAPLEALGAQHLFVSFAQPLDLADTASHIEVTDAVMHPRFGHDMGNLFDVGVLLFDPDDTPVGLTPALVAPVRYLNELGAIRSERFTAVGYGTVRESKTGGWRAIMANLYRRHADQGFRSLQKAWVTLNMNPSTGSGGTCYGDSGGPHFHNGMIVSITVTGDAVCRATDKTYRLDTPWVHNFLGPYMT